MAVFEALRTALDALKRNPVLFVASLLFGLVTLPQTVVQFAGVPFAPLVLQVVTFFVTPFFLAGIIGMALESRTGRTSLSTLTSRGKERYVPLLLGNVIQFAITIAVGIVASIVGVALFLTVGGVGGSPSGAALAVVGFGVVVLALLVALVFFFIQFFSVAIVVDELGPIDGFSRSVEFVRDHLVSTLGYSVIRLLVGLLVSAPVTGFVLYRTVAATQPLGTGATGSSPGAMAGAGASPFASLAPTTIAALSLASLVVTTLLVAFEQSYAVAFYTHHEEREELLLE